MKTPAANDFLVIDLSPSSVKAVYLSGETPYVAKGFSVKNLINQNCSKSDFKEVIEEAVNQNTFSSKNVILGLSGNQVIGFVLIVKSKREEPEKEITEKEVNDLYVRIKKCAILQAQEKWSVLYADDVAFVPLDLVVTSTELNDSSVDDLVGKTGEEIKTSVFCSYAVKSYYDETVKDLKALKYNLTAVTTTLYTQSKLLNEKNKNYILIDVGEVQTEVAVVLGGNIVQTRAFNIGGEFFTKTLSKKLGVDMKNAQGKKEAYGLNTLSDDEKDGVEDHLYDAGKTWRLGLKTVLDSMSGIKSFPGLIYVTGGGGNLSIVSELLYEENWKKSVAFATDLDVKLANSDLWQNHVRDELNVLNGPGLFGPVTVALINLELQENE